MAAIVSATIRPETQITGFDFRNEDLCSHKVPEWLARSIEADAKTIELALKDIGGDVGSTKLTDLVGIIFPDNMRMLELIASLKYVVTEGGLDKRPSAVSTIDDLQLFTPKDLRTTPRCHGVIIMEVERFLASIVLAAQQLR